MTTEAKPLYRVGPAGIRRVARSGVEFYLGPFDGELFLPEPLPDLKISIRPDFTPPTVEEIAELERQQREAEERNALWHACRERELRGEPPGFSAWVNQLVIHLSYTPFCAFPSTECGQHIEEHWHTAVGIQDMHRGRVCKRCAWKVARSMADAARAPRPTTFEYFTYRQPHKERSTAIVGRCPGSETQVTGRVGYREKQPERFNCPHCGVSLSPRQDGKLRVHPPAEVAS